MKLKDFEFDPKDIEQFVHQFDKIDASVDMKEAQKAKIALKRKIKEIKAVHIENKKTILSFKRSVEAADLKNYTDLTLDLITALSRIESDIDKVNTSQALRAQKIENKISEISNTMINDILDAKTIKEIEDVKTKINNIKANKTSYDNRVGDVESLKTTLILKAGGRELEITKAGGEIKSNNIKPLDINKNQELPVNDQQRITDTDLLNFIQSVAAGKGWKVDISPSTGVAIYQVSDPNRPKDIRTAIENAYAEHTVNQQI